MPLDTAKRLLKNLAALGVLAMTANCASGSYTGPLEVTRFSAEAPTQPLAQGTITVILDPQIENEAAREAFARAVEAQMLAAGYELSANSAQGRQSAQSFARVTTSRQPVETASQRRNPVNVGVGAGAGTFGSGAGLGVGINLGGGEKGPRIVSQLGVRITAASGETLWEGRAQFPTSVNSPYAPLAINARTLAAALFANFPGESGKTVQLDAENLQANP